MERHDSLTSFEHWRDLAQTHPWPLGLAALSVIWLLILIPWPHTPDAQIDLLSVHDAPVAAEYLLDANAHEELPADGVITAKRIRVVGHVLLTGPVALVANEIEFTQGSRIWVPSGELTVIAPHISGGEFDVSGVRGGNGKQAGAPGQDGATAGSAYIAAAEFSNVTVLANGGAGGDGQRGYAGVAGRNGFCGPRGFGLAERGKVGGNGGDAGAGGSSGLVSAWYSGTPPQISAEPGKPGTAGRGGAGCKGVRGSQAAQSAGNEGVAGRNGSHGQTGTINRRHVEFSAVVDAYEQWLSDRASPQVLLERLRALPEIEG